MPKVDEAGEASEKREKAVSRAIRNKERMSERDLPAKRGERKKRDPIRSPLRGWGLQRSSA